MTKTTITYEMKTCGRCGGTGHYSYNSMHGTVCYGCSGHKRTLSKAGAKARAAVEAFKKEHFSAPVEALVAGDRIIVDGKARTIASVETSGGSRYGVKDANGDMVWKDYVSLTFTKPYATGFGPCSSVGYCQGTTVVRAITGADWDALVAFARTLKKGVTVTETETPVAAPAAAPPA